MITCFDCSTKGTYYSVKQIVKQFDVETQVDVAFGMCPLCKSKRTEFS